MIALLCATLLCLSAAEPIEPPRGIDMPRLREPSYDPKWKFVMHFYGRDIVVDGWESKRECDDQAKRMQRRYPEAIIDDCEESR